MFKISEFARLSGLSIDTLYHYEKKKLLIPREIDNFTRYRSYDASQLVTVNKILALKDAGFSLDEIASILNNNPSITSLLKMLEEKALLIENELNKELVRFERLKTNIFLIKNGGIPLMNEITIKRVEPILIASIRKAFSKSEFDNELEGMWKDVNQYIDDKGGKHIVPCMMLYHKGWWDFEKRQYSNGSEVLDVEVVEPVIKPFDGNELVRVYELPAVDKMACIVHNGPFSTIAKTNEALYDFISYNNYTIAGAMREIYHKGDWLTDNPDEYITELQIPLE